MVFYLFVFITGFEGNAFQLQVANWRNTNAKHYDHAEWHFGKRVPTMPWPKNEKKAKKGILSMLNNALDDDRNLKYKSTSDLSVGKENPFFFGNEIWDTPHFAHFTD